MLQRSAFLILGLLYITSLVCAQELTDDSNTKTPVLTQNSNLTRSTASEESNESEDVEHEAAIPIEILNCGSRNSKGIGSSGDEILSAYEKTKFGEFPWLVSISEEIEMDVYIFECTGALISSNVVVSTAHCGQPFIKNPKTLVIKAGVWNSSITNDEYPVQKRYAKKIIVLEHFDKNFHMNDIAVIILETPINLKDHIQPICLPSVWQSFMDQNCFLNYWDIDNGNVNSRKADLLVVSSKQCQEKLNVYKATKDLPIHESIICATSEKNSGDCDKQLGAVLVCPIPGMIDRYYLAGLNSIGYGCNKNNYIGLFVNVALLRRWILSFEG